MTQTDCRHGWGGGASGEKTLPRKRGIPTLYRGVLMRSRLEAKFAALFDRWGWRWEYEPQDLKCYLPDFVLHLHQPLLVEVKALPVEYDEAEKKINASGWEGEALIVSGTIDGSHIGRFGSLVSGPDGSQLYWCAARVFWCLNCGSVSVRPEDGDWNCRVCGEGYGNAHVGEHDPAEDWAWSTNRVQWRPQ